MSIGWISGRAVVLDNGRQTFRRFVVLSLTGPVVTKLSLVYYWPFEVTFSALVLGRRFTYEH